MRYLVSLVEGDTDGPLWPLHAHTCAHTKWTQDIVTQQDLGKGSSEGLAGSHRASILNSSSGIWDNMFSVPSYLTPAVTGPSLPPGITPRGVTIPGSWECVVVPRTFRSGVCALVVVLLADSVVLGVLVVALLVALGVAGLLVVASWRVRPAVLGGWFGLSHVLEVWGRGVELGPEDMAFRIQSWRRVMRAYTPGFLAWAQPMPQLTMPAR